MQDDNSSIQQINLEAADKDSRAIVVNAESGSTVSVHVGSATHNYAYPRWLDEMVKEHVRWEE